MNWSEIVHTPYSELEWREADRIVNLFIAAIPRRLEALIDRMRKAGYEDWSADYSDKSLLALGEWALKTLRRHKAEPYKVWVDPKLPKEVQEGVHQDIVNGDS